MEFLITLYRTFIFFYNYMKKCKLIILNNIINIINVRLIISNKNAIFYTTGIK